MILKPKKIHSKFKLTLSLFHNQRDGRQLDDEEIAGMMIGLLMAGQHTSSTTSAWLGFFLAKHKHLQVRINAPRTYKSN